MIVGRLDAIVIFGKWREEKSRMRCQGSFATHAFAMEGIIQMASDSEVRMIAGNNLTQVVVKLTDDLKFNYADSREVTGDEAKNYSSCLTLCFGEVPDEGPIDTIAFAEITQLRSY